MPLRRWMVGACLGLFAVTGCNCGDEKLPEVLGNGTIGAIAPAASGATGGFTAPLDATPSPDGKEVYFTARNTDGVGVFKASASGGTITPLHVGDPISGPVGITVSSDNQMVFIADPGASINDEDQGAIWMVPTQGGTPTLVNGTSGHAPRGLTLVNEAGTDQLYFTGKTPADNEPGVFKVAASGGTVEGIVKGSPFSDPNGIAITRQGTIYVVDSAAGDLSAGSARVIQVADNAATVFHEGLKVGFPAGIALSQDDSVALISAVDPARGTDLVVRVNLATKEESAYSSGIEMFEEAAGLHRASNAEVYAWCDSTANGSGTVFVLTP
jgi:DNA-binding beta-propeller fold protein YncE